MAKYMDEAQEKLHDIMEQYDGDAFNLLNPTQRDDADVGGVGRALYHQLKGHGAALRFIESRLRDIHDTSENLQKHTLEALKAINATLQGLLWLAFIEGAVIIYLLWPRR